MRREDALREFEAKADAMLTAQEAMFWERLFVRKSQVAARLRESLARLARKAAARKKDCRYIYCSLLRVDLLTRNRWKSSWIWGTFLMNWRPCGWSLCRACRGTGER